MTTTAPTPSPAPSPCVSQAHPRKDGDRPQNLGVLLIEFFELYGIQYNYDNVVITTIDGGK